MEDLQKRHSWVRVYSYEISGNAENRELYRQMAANLNRPAGQTPAFFYCKQLQIGYGSYQQTGRRIEQEMIRWYEWLKKQQDQEKETRGIEPRGFIYLVKYAADDVAPPAPEEPPDLPPPAPEPADESVHIPGMGDVEIGSLSLPMLTLVLAGCDALNPCAFFVLLLLLVSWYTARIARACCSSVVPSFSSPG